MPDMNFNSKDILLSLRKQSFSNDYALAMQDIWESQYEVSPNECRSNIGFRSKIGLQMQYQHNYMDSDPLKDSYRFPMLLGRHVSPKVAFHELMWMLSGDTNVKYLNDNGVTIWNLWADKNGNLGKVYGRQWRDFRGNDQIRDLIEGLKKNPFGRRHLVSAWNPADLGVMALPPCHYSFQVICKPVKSGIIMDMVVTMRSCDMPIGFPYNQMFYSMLLILLAKHLGYYAGTTVINIGDAHIYNNQVEGVKETVKNCYKAVYANDFSEPTIEMEEILYRIDLSHLQSLKFEDVVKVTNKNTLVPPKIKIPVAV